MKLLESLILSVLAILVFAASPIFAASPFLPISSTNTFGSGERTAVEAAVAQAEAQGKFVLVEMMAAWCGPCNELAKEQIAKKDELASTMAHFVTVRLEEMHMEVISGVDFLPHEVPWFPSLYLYNPRTAKWTLLYVFDALSVKAVLDDYIAHTSLSGYYMQEIRSGIASGAKIGSTNLLSAIFSLALEDSGPALLTAAADVVKAMKANPTQFEMSVTDFEEQMDEAYMRSIEMGKLTFSQIRAAIPTAFTGYDTTPLLRNRILFRGPLSHLIRTQGNKAASDQCAALSTAANDALTGASANTQRRFALVRSMVCLSLQLQLKEKSYADALALEASMTSAERSAHAYELAKVFALCGTGFAKAIDYAKIWKADYESRYAGEAELLARITKATDARIAAYASAKSHP